LLLSFNISVNAATEAQIQHIRDAAEKYILRTLESPPGGKIVATAAPLDNRIQVSDCPSPLQVSSPAKSVSTSNVTVLVKCEPENWHVYVPVRLHVTVPAVVATRTLIRGQTIGKQDIAIRMVERLRFRQQGFSSLNQVIGAKLKRNISIHDIIDNNDICIVCRNEAVIIKAVKNGLTITTQGTALSDGILGEQIRVKNNKSKRIIEARVSGTGEVIVRF
jgi:flagella basal body P-ring formation protein FlgA